MSANCKTTKGEPRSNEGPLFTKLNSFYSLPHLHINISPYIPKVLTQGIMDSKIKTHS